MPTSAILSALDFARDAVHDAAIDRAATSGRGLYGSDFYVVVLADLGNGNQSRVDAEALGLQRASDTGAAAYVGAVAEADMTVVFVSADDTNTYPEFPAATADACLVVAVKDGTAVIFEHTTRAALGRAQRAAHKAYVASVAARVVESEADPVQLPASGADDYGSDISTFVANPDGVLDLDPTFTIITGTRVVAEAIARRLMTDRGTLAYDPGFGLDLRNWLQMSVAASGGGANSTTARNVPSIFGLKSSLEQECLKDERVDSAAADVVYDRSTERVTIRVGITLISNVRFRLVLTIDAVTAAVLKVTT
jgi:hypothetical protein